jgi:hypothetical protein
MTPSRSPPFNNNSV